MDMTRAITAKSDQLNADDLIGGPQTFTIVEVREGNDDQPVSIVLAEWPKSRPFKPSKTVARILTFAWGIESDDWPEGARMTLFRDPDVTWAGQAVGGIRVSHLSHIDGPLKVALQETKKTKALHTVLPIPAVAAQPTPAELAEQLVSALADATIEAEVKEWGNRAHARNLLDIPIAGATVRAHVEQRLAELAEKPNVETGGES